MTALALYFSPGASSMAVHIALHEIGVPFEAKPVSFLRKETRTPQFLALNPAGKVPT
ncbi:glutathione S-transferase N-terminal domain-containing protein, partial [Reyranella sp.]|uniref:glutathione S-transferase N-terminal domain-containing protein n=1 Tax=Reyranella sp. TaxID=1929291 RepID=UPI0039C92B0D